MLNEIKNIAKQTETLAASNAKLENILGEVKSSNSTTKLSVDDSAKFLKTKEIEV